MQKILNIIAIIAFLLSLYNFVIDLIEKVKRINLEVVTIYPMIKGKECTYCFRLLISNKSRLPLSISNIEITYEGTTYPVVREEVQIVERQTRKAGIVTANKELFATKFPVNLHEYNSQNVYIITNYTENLKLKPNDEIKFKIYTSRGAITKATKVIGFSTSSELLSPTLLNLK